METSITACPHGRTWSKERVHAGTFRLSGISFSHASTPRSHLAASLAVVDGSAVNSAKIAWTRQASTSEPPDAVKHIQRAWNAHITMAVYNSLLQTCSSPIDQARLKALVTPHVGDWLHAPPLTSVGLRLSEEPIRMATSYRHGTTICQPQTCVCGAIVDARWLHGLACRKSVPRHVRHSQLNTLIWRTVKKTQTPANKEPIRLSRADGKRPEGAILVSWTRGKPLASDVTVPDTYAASHIHTHTYIKKVKSVQRRFTKRVKGIAELQYKRLAILRAKTLELRRLKDDLMYIYKIDWIWSLTR